MFRAHYETCEFWIYFIFEKKLGVPRTDACHFHFCEWNNDPRGSHLCFTWFNGRINFFSVLFWCSQIANEKCLKTQPVNSLPKREKKYSPSNHGWIYIRCAMVRSETHFLKFRSWEFASAPTAYAAQPHIFFPFLAENLRVAFLTSCCFAKQHDVEPKRFGNRYFY